MKIRANLAIGGGLTLLSLFVGVFGPWLAHTDPIMDANLMNAELPPGAEFWFGTDQQGRDIWSRVMYGAQISLTVGIGSQGIVFDGTPAQQAQWLPRLATGEMIASFALTEPGAGSDAASLRTTAIRGADADGDHYLVNGSKR